MQLPRGATAVDFAYAVHTDVGNQCVAVKIDRRLMPLRSELYNGQTVEIITAAGARPNPAWLNFVHTAKARANIRNFLKNLQHDEAVSLGQRLLNKSLEQYGSSLQALPEKNIYHVTDIFKLSSFDKLLMEIGLGNRMPMQVARALIQGAEEKPGTEIKRTDSETKPLAIKGTEGTVVTYAKCCRPIPGDKILGFVTAGRGVVIHVDGCKNVADYRNKPEKWIDVEWEKSVAGEFPVELRLLVANQRGVLATIAAAISDLDANIENVVMDERDGQHSSLTFTVAVKDRKHLARIIKRLRSLSNVVRIARAQK
jgi:guanosine-3',5'-bis(diphosphate) 3'-pyrophosphohydrolase